MRMMRRRIKLWRMAMTLMMASCPLVKRGMSMRSPREEGLTAHGHLVFKLEA
jgi:hypothetical protein